MMIVAVVACPSPEREREGRKERRRRNNFTPYPEGKRGEERAAEDGGRTAVKSEGFPDHQLCMKVY
jgi:hypothetical protein